jgi:hypothetical protein
VELRAQLALERIQIVNDPHVSFTEACPCGAI